MADWSLKNIEDIKVGDKVLANGGGYNTVVATHNGISNGFRIIPNVGKEQEFTVSSDHYLTCLYRKYKNGNKPYKEQLVDIKIEDYMALSPMEKRHYWLYRPKFEGTHDTNLKIDPYILGVWLGDGHSRSIVLTNTDKPIVEEWYSYAESLNLKVHVTSSGYTYDITSGTKQGPMDRNIALNNFRYYNLLNNKHIPQEYLLASREQRLQLLAGIVDTDGWYDKRQACYSITTKLESLREDYNKLVISLGFKPTLGITRPKLPDGTRGLYYTISFSGPLWEVPVRLERKRHAKPKIIRNSQVTRFTVEPVPQVEYYGFECDGDHRFILGNGFITHNSWLLLKFLAEAWKQGYRVGLYSGEMSHIKLGYRFDALFGHFSNRALVQGCQDGVNGYQEYIKNMCNMDNPFMIITQKEFGGRPTVQQLRNFVEENNIQILGVDQLSLMDDGRATMRDPTRIRLSHISEDLFLLSTEYKIPILALAQANRDGINKDDQTQAPGLENIKESDDIAHNSSKCLGMRQSNFGLVLDVIKNREGKVGDKLLYSWDIDTGTFDYIPSAGDAAPAQIRQQTTQQVKQDFAQPGAINPF